MTQMDEQKLRCRFFNMQKKESLKTNDLIIDEPAGALGPSGGQI